MTREIYTHVTRRMLDIATETITKAVGDIANEASGSPGGSPGPDENCTEGEDDAA